MKSNFHLKKAPPLFVIRATGALRKFLISLGTRMFPPDYNMMEIASSLWLAKAVSVAASLGLADLLKERPLHISELAERTQTHEPSLLRLMRLLSGNGIFRHCGGHHYENTRLSTALIKERRSMHSYFLHHVGDSTWPFLGNMEWCVRTGENAIKMQTGMEPFDYLAANPERNAIFSEAMTDTSEMAAPLFLRAFPFGRYSKIVDVGGGHGFLAAAIAAKHKNTECVVLDLPHVAPLAAKNFEKFGVQNRCSFVNGDFFGEIPGGADLYMMKNVLHDWDDAKCVEILKNIGSAMPSHARLLLVESLVDDCNRSHFGKILDLQMLVGTSGGRERTKEEFRQLLRTSGFELQRIINTATPFYFMVGRQV